MIKNIVIVMPGSGEGRGQEPVVLNRIHALDEAGYHITFLCLQKHNQSSVFIEKIKKKYPNVQVEVIYRTINLITIGSIIINVLNGLPIQNALFFNKEIKIAYENHLSEEKHFIFVTSRSYPVTLKIKNFSIDFIDSIALNLSRRANFSFFPLKQILEFESSRLKILEERLANDAHHAFAVSQIDANYLCKEKVTFLPLGVADVFFHTPLKEKKYDIIFFGNLFYHPNILAINYFISQILPHITKEREISLILAGRNPPKEIIKLENKIPNLSIIKNPISIPDLLAECRISVAPMQSGSGMQNKILESMAAGVPVVCNTLGLGTIGAEIGKDILVEDDPKKFAAAILRLLEDEEYLSDITKNGKHYITQHHDWAKINQQFASYF